MGIIIVIYQLGPAPRSRPRGALVIGGRRSNFDSFRMLECHCGRLYLRGGRYRDIPDTLFLIFYNL